VKKECCCSTKKRLENKRKHKDPYINRAGKNIETFLTDFFFSAVSVSGVDFTVSAELYGKTNLVKFRFVIMTLRGFEMP
jgi:hypothetical protein